MRRDVGVPLLIYLATRVAQLAAIAWLRPPGSDSIGSDSIRTRLLSWDSGWFIRVAAHGYPHGYTTDGTGALTANGLAFFPLYPAMIRALHTIGFSYGSAALTIAWLAGGVAAVLLYALARHLWGATDPERGRRIGYALVVLFCAQPMSVVLSMGYTESLFVALVAGTLLAAYRHAWLTAGMLGVLAGLTRPTGLAAAIALAVAAGVVLADRATPLAERLRAVGASIAALASVPAYILWVGQRVGDPHAWFRIQTAGWGTTFDYGASTWSFVESTLRAGTGWVGMSVVLLLIAAVLAAAIAIRRRVWPPLLVYGLIALALVIGQAGYYHSKPRLLVPVLLILVPAALAAGRVRLRAAVPWLVAYAAFGLWYGAYMITVWPYAI